jgi:hypothetical protein
MYDFRSTSGKKDDRNPEVELKVIRKTVTLSNQKFPERMKLGEGIFSALKRRRYKNVFVSGNADCALLDSEKYPTLLLVWNSFYFRVEDLGHTDKLCEVLHMDYSKLRVSGTVSR